MKVGITKGGIVSVWKQKRLWISIVFLVFGTLTLLSGGRSLFTEAGILARGNAVPLVLWFNFIAGIFYIITGASVFMRKSCVQRLAVVMAVLNSIVLFYLFMHILQGGLYENRTVVAMSFRTAFWLAFAIYFHKSDLERETGL
jgi:hypothetical protein